jgi:hypothetical protein
MFYIIPYTNYEIKLLRNKDIVLERFCNSVNVVQNLSFTTVKSYKDFEGVLYHDGFSFRRLMKLGYSAFLPILFCRIHKNEKDISLKINIRFHKYVTIGILVFFLFQISILTLDFNFIAIFIIPYLLIIYLFNKEVKLLTEKFKEIIITNDVYKSDK